MSNRITLFLAAATLFLSQGATPLRAGDTVKIGGAIALALPTSDLKGDTHNKVGYGAAFQVTFDLGKGHALRPRADLFVFDVKEGRLPGTDRREVTELVNAGLGVDYLYYFGGKTDRGLYAIAGLSLQDWNVSTTTHDWDDHGSGDTTQKVSHRRTALGGTLGLGYQVNSWFGVEALYATASYKGAQGTSLVDGTPEMPSTNRTGGSFQVAATFRW